MLALLCHRLGLSLAMRVELTTTAGRKFALYHCPCASSLFSSLNCSMKSITFLHSKRKSVLHCPYTTWSAPYHLPSTHLVVHPSLIFSSPFTALLSSTVPGCSPLQCTSSSPDESR